MLPARRLPATGLCLLMLAVALLGMSALAAPAGARRTSLNTPALRHTSVPRARSAADRDSQADRRQEGMRAASGAEPGNAPQSSRGRRAPGSLLEQRLGPGRLRSRRREHRRSRGTCLGRPEAGPRVRTHPRSKKPRPRTSRPQKSRSKKGPPPNGRGAGGPGRPGNPHTREARASLGRAREIGQTSSARPTGDCKNDRSQAWIDRKTHRYGRQRFSPPSWPRS